LSKFLCLLILVSILAACDDLPFLETEQDGLKTSGVVEAVEIAVAPQAGGRVLEVYVNEGDPVEIGKTLFTLDDTLLSSQYRQAQAAYETVQANLEAAEAAHDLALANLVAAETAVELVQIQYQQVFNQARFVDQANRTGIWNRQQPDEFETPPWYFTKSDKLAASEAEVAAAKEALDEEQSAYEELLEDDVYADLREAEARLAQAQAAYIVAQSMLNREIDQLKKSQLNDVLQSDFDDAEAELEQANTALDEILADETADDILEAKARITSTQERYETALDLWSSLLTGEQALEVQGASVVLEQAEVNVMVAEAAVSQAEAGVSAAEKAVAQAQVSVDTIDVQRDELTVYAPDSGIILVRNVEPGEVIQPGMTAMTIGQLDELTVTVYIPENRYGLISLGDPAQVTTDSFPGEVFKAVVTRIADQAEFTPRNVQTEEDRSTIVFAIELMVDDPSGKLKPGMPVDVVFE